MTLKSKDEKIRSWHLVRSHADNEIVELEWILLRLMRSFNRFNEQMIASRFDISLSAAELHLLHVIRMHGTPKTANMLARLLNREDDQSNVQYGLKKLRDMKMIRTHPKSKATTFQYEATKLGIEITDAFAEFKKKYINEAITEIRDWEGRIEHTKEFLRFITGIYDEASYLAMTTSVTRKRD
ncbi:MAG: winged helix DNA-binding protein [Dehalococcoidia bacterium]|jgi:predicted MarR family transcription regulator